MVEDKDWVCMVYVFGMIREMEEDFGVVTNDG